MDFPNITMGVLLGKEYFPPGTVDVDGLFKPDRATLINMQNICISMSTHAFLYNTVVSFIIYFCRMKFK